MPKRPESNETLRLLLEIIKRIPKSRKISGPELRKQLIDAGIERDLRTIQRHLEMLTEHFDIECDDSDKPYGYRWKENAHGFSAPGLTEQESLMLTLAEEQLRYQLPAGLMKSMSSFFDQARGNLRNPGSNQKAREWLGKVRVVNAMQPLLPPKIKEGVFETLSQALYDDRWLELDYRNAKGEKKVAEVMPLGIAQQGQRTYLVCRFKDYDNERTLALHRINAARAKTLTFQRPAGFNLQKYDDDGRFRFGEGKRIQLTFRIEKSTGEHLFETPLSKDQQIKDLGLEYEVSATVVESEQLRKWLRGFGKDVSQCSIAL